MINSTADEGTPAKRRRIWPTVSELNGDSATTSEPQSDSVPAAVNMPTSTILELSNRKLEEPSEDDLRTARNKLEEAAKARRGQWFGIYPSQVPNTNLALTYAGGLVLVMADNDARNRRTTTTQTKIQEKQDNIRRLQIIIEQQKEENQKAKEVSEALEFEKQSLAENKAKLEKTKAIADEARRAAVEQAELEGKARRLRNELKELNASIAAHKTLNQTAEAELQGVVAAGAPTFIQIERLKGKITDEDNAIAKELDFLRCVSKTVMCHICYKSVSDELIQACRMCLFATCEDCCYDLKKTATKEAPLKCPECRTATTVFDARTGRQELFSKSDQFVELRRELTTIFPRED